MQDICHINFIQRLCHSHHGLLCYVSLSPGSQGVNPYNHHGHCQPWWLRHTSINSGNNDIRCARIVEIPTKFTVPQLFAQQNRRILHWHVACFSKSIEPAIRAITRGQHHAIGKYNLLGTAMAATFQLKSNDDGQYYFHFLDGSGELLMMSGEYPQKEEAEQAIKDVQVGSLMSEQIGAGKVPAGDTFFVIKDNRGDILVKSVLFNSRMVFDNALHAVKDSACIAEITDLT
jgi:hypothetical protein